MTDRPIEWAILRRVWSHAASGMLQVRIDDIECEIPAFTRTALIVAIVALSRSTTDRPALLTADYGYLGLTEAGEAAMGGAGRSPYFRTDDRAWRDEALSGIRANGSRSEICNAAMPTGSTVHGMRERDWTPDPLGLAMMEVVAAECDVCGELLPVDKFTAGKRTCKSCRAAEARARRQRAE